MPPRLSNESVVNGSAPNSDWNGLKILGSYGSSFLTESYVCPAGYVAARFGPNSERNAVSFREHVSADWQGARLIEGNQRRYPIISSFMARSLASGSVAEGR